MLLKRECLMAQGVSSNNGEGRSRAGVDIQTLADQLEAVLVSSLPLDLNTQINGRHSTEAYCRCVKPNPGPALFVL